jgi:hypothetical protein
MTVSTARTGVSYQASSDLSKDLLDYLKGWALVRELNKAAQHMAVTPMEWVLQHGKPFAKRHTLPKRQTRPNSRECYHNAWKRCRMTGHMLRYCEGYVALDSCPIPVMHGWCLNPDGEVEDPSVDNARPAAYYGVVYQPEFAFETWTDLILNNAIGILGNAWMLHLTHDDILKGVDHAAL